MPESDTGTAGKALVEDGKPGPKGSTWRYLERAFAIIGAVAALAAIAAFAISMWPRASKSPEQIEKAKIARIEPGDDLTHVSEVFGQRPDVHMQFGRRILYLYDRRFEYILALANESGTTLSLGVEPKKRDFRPGSWASPIGESFATLSDWRARALAACGADYFEYLESDEGSHATNSINTIAGVGGSSVTASGDLCSRINKCPPSDENRFSRRLYRCIVSSEEGRRALHESRIGIWIETAPHQRPLPAMAAQVIITRGS